MYLECRDAVQNSKGPRLCESEEPRKRPQKDRAGEKGRCIASFPKWKSGGSKAASRLGQSTRGKVKISYIRENDCSA